MIEVMPFAATWMDLKIITLDEVSHMEKDKYHDITYLQNLKKNDTDELIYKTERDSQTQRKNLQLQGVGSSGRMLGGRDSQGI